MELSTDLVADVIQACRLAWPDEACGLLHGPAGESGPTEERAMRNVSEFRRYRYAMDPDEQLAAWRAIEAAGHRVWAIYHSHTAASGATELSPEDMRYALDPDVWHLVVGLASHSAAPALRLWKVVDGAAIEQGLGVV